MDDTLTLPFLQGLQRTGIRPGLGRMRRLVARLGHPERAFPSVLVTGTNGKGSTSAFLAAMLSAAGYRTGLFTSPHLVDVRERVRIGGAVLDADRFAAYGAEVRAAMAPGPSGRAVRATFFEALSALGFLAFAREPVDVAVVEVGMGGRLDSTNVLDPVVSVLTNVSLDHTHFLGPDEASIAREKLGVARRGRPFVTAADGDIWRDVMAPALARVGARPLRLGPDFQVARTGGRIDWRGGSVAIEGAPLGLQGTFQAENAALALAAAEALAEAGIRVGPEAMRAGLAAASWPGRYERVAVAPDVLLDGCHNPGAATRLRETLRACPPDRPLVMVHGTKPDKDFLQVLATLAPLCDRVIETGIAGLADPVTLVEAARRAAPGVPVEAEPDLAAAVARAKALAGPGGTVLITGSLYLVGAAMAGRVWERSTGNRKPETGNGQ